MPMINESCPACNKSVYPNEAKLASGVMWHPMCFKCANCSKMLDSTTVAGHEGKVYCKMCYKKEFADTTKDRLGMSIKGPQIEGGCPRCSKRVYDAEKQTGGGKDWHKSCYNCITCHRALDSTTACEGKAEIYCKNCYAKAFSPVGKH